MISSVGRVVSSGSPYSTASIPRGAAMRGSRRPAFDVQTRSVPSSEGTPSASGWDLSRYLKFVGLLLKPDVVLVRRLVRLCHRQWPLFVKKMPLPMNPRMAMRVQGTRFPVVAQHTGEARHVTLRRGPIRCVRSHWIRAVVPHAFRRWPPVGGVEEIERGSLFLKPSACSHRMNRRSFCGAKRAAQALRLRRRAGRSVDAVDKAFSRAKQKVRRAGRRRLRHKAGSAQAAAARNRGTLPHSWHDGTETRNRVSTARTRPRRAHARTTASGLCNPHDFVRIEGLDVIPVPVPSAPRSYE
jgi:hypothetical protein